MKILFQSLEGFFCNNLLRRFDFTQHDILNTMCFIVTGIFNNVILSEVKATLNVILIFLPSECYKN